jgi:hypothetical protein
LLENCEYNGTTEELVQIQKKTSQHDWPHDCTHGKKLKLEKEKKILMVR